MEVKSVWENLRKNRNEIATSFIGEGLEEVASDILDPALQRVTGVDQNAQVDWGNLPRTFLVGGATGAVMGGGQRVLRAAQAGDFSSETLDYQAETEMYADFVAREILGNEDVVRRLVAKERNIAVRFLEWVRSALKRLGGSRETQSEYKALKKTEKLLSAALENAKGGVSLEEVEEGVQRMKALRDMFEQEGEGDSSATRQNDNVEQKETTEQNSVDVDAQSSARYSIDEKFSDRIEKWDGETVGFSFVVGRTSDALRSIGVSERQIRWDATKIKRILSEHSMMSKEIIKKVPQVIESPIIIMDSKQIADRLVILGDVYDEHGDIVTVILELSPTRKNIKGDSAYLDIIKIASAQGRSNTQGLINGSKIRYVDKNEKRVNEWLKVNRLQLPLLSTTTDSTTIIRENTEKSTENVKKVEKYSRKSLDVDSEGRELTKEQAEYFKDSKVRDKDGNLLVVYHGTRKADFTVFKRNVNFFTDSIEMANSYSPNSERYTGYLDIKNPFVVDAKGEKWSKIPIEISVKEMLDKYGASTFKEGGKWRTSPADIASAIEEGIDEGEFDYDGIIIKNVDDTGEYWKTRGDIIANDYIVFKSNQFKNADNKTPTKNPDIRYSIDADGTVKQSEKEKRESGYVSSLRNYLHRLNISEETKADVIEKYGERTAKRLFAVWENTTGREDGVDIVTAHKELWGKGFRGVFYCLLLLMHKKYEYMNTYSYEN